MSNTPIISYPSQLGIPQCISEQVIYNATTVPVAGGGKWQRIKGTAVTGELTGQCYKTEQELPSTVNYIKHGQPLQAMLVSVTDVAEVAGRAVVQYRYLIQQDVPYLPQIDKLVCLYVPRWQEEHGNVLYDLSGNNRHMTLTNASYDADGNFVNNNSRGIWRGNAGTIRDYTIIANRRLREAHVGDQYGFLLSWLNNNATVAMEIRQSNEDRCKSLGVVTHNITYPNYDGWAHQRTADYCGQPIGHGTQYRLDYGVSFSGASLRMAWLTVRSVAAWSVSLTDMEIQVAKMYLAQEHRPADL